MNNVVSLCEYRKKRMQRREDMFKNIVTVNIELYLPGEIKELNIKGKLVYNELEDTI